MEWFQREQLFYLMIGIALERAETPESAELGTKALLATTLSTQIFNTIRTAGPK